LLQILLHLRLAHDELGDAGAKLGGIGRLLDEEFASSSSKPASLICKEICTLSTVRYTQMCADAQPSSTTR
jgi:hypothetical protein